MATASSSAVSIGMLGVTIFGLFLTPAFYVLLRSMRRKRVGATAP
jgi:hypothetical protein